MSSLREHESDSAVIKEQAAQLALMFRESRHTVVFTGAGISTASGIPDFRGPNGVWTKEEKGEEIDYGTDPTKAIPSDTHMALAGLRNAAMVSFVISQNVDGLHSRSGIERQFLAELHGCVNLEICKSCGKEYYRDFWCPKDSNNARQHKTGRKCTCGKDLYDTIVNFSEPLPQKALDQSFEHAKECQLFVVLGSSLLVTPASDLPEQAKKHGAKLVICNLQKTPLDDVADLRVFAKSDELMCELMKCLFIGMAKWKLKRCVHIEFLSMTTERKLRKNRAKLTVSCLSEDGEVISSLKTVQVDDKVKRCEPFEFDLICIDGVQQPSKIMLSFMGNFSEPPFLIEKAFDFNFGKQNFIEKIQYTPGENRWITETESYSTTM